MNNGDGLLLRKMRMAEPGVDYEVLELAIDREIEANQFFLILAARTRDPQMRAVFKELAAEELEHKDKLELEIMKSGMVVGQRKEFESVGRVAEDDDFGVDVEMDYKDMLIIGMQKEEASFRLYVDLAGRVGDPKSRETLLAIAEQEVRHKLRFEIEYDKILKKESE